VTCYKPKPGKRIVKRDYYGPGVHQYEPCERPCGGCIGCRLDYSIEWAIRCVHEAVLWEENCFLTLTYRNEDLPPDGSLQKKHVQNFMKYLRKEISPRKVRFYGAGEYGDKGFRPHYHICLFNYDFPDKVLFRQGSRRFHNGVYIPGHDKDLYISKMLERIWGKGFCTIGELSYQSAAYVARYVTKKITGTSELSQRMIKNRYQGKEREFALMSRRPGIGADFFKKYFNDLFPKDFTTVDGHKKKIPRYYDYLLENQDSELFQHIQEFREEKQLTFDKKVENAKKRAYLERYKKLMTKCLIRKVE
jgi:hypothetical protein